MHNQKENCVLFVIARSDQASLQYITFLKVCTKYSRVQQLRFPLGYTTPRLTYAVPAPGTRQFGKESAGPLL